MPDAWQILSGNSSLPTGDAWQHLNAQEGGGEVIDGIGPSTADVDYSSLSADTGTLLSASVEDIILEADLAESLSTSIEDENLTTEVCP